MPVITDACMADHPFTLDYACRNVHHQRQRGDVKQKRDNAVRPDAFPRHTQLTASSAHEHVENESAYNQVPSLTH